jgi:uncharacterized protein (TIGR02594 family)
MMSLPITAYDLAERFIGIREIPGSTDNPQVLAMLRLDAQWPLGDEVPWCSAFINYVCWLLRLPRSKSLMARSWLGVGTAIGFDEAKPGFDIVILRRLGTDQPGPDVLDAPGHVGFFSGFVNPEELEQVAILGGNQGDSVSVAMYGTHRILGIRRILPASRQILDLTV